MGKKLRYKEGEGINFGVLKSNPNLPDLSLREQAKLWAKLGAQAKKERGEKEPDSE